MHFAAPPDGEKRLAALLACSCRAVEQADVLRLVIFRLRLEIEGRYCQRSVGSVGIVPIEGEDHEVGFLLDQIPLVGDEEEEVVLHEHPIGGATDIEAGDAGGQLQKLIGGDGRIAMV